jgi:hypothetical protein
VSIRNLMKVGTGPSGVEQTRRDLPLYVAWRDWIFDPSTEYKQHRVTAMGRDWR